jgi:hypothetical protein
MAAMDAVDGQRASAGAGGMHGAPGARLDELESLRREVEQLRGLLPERIDVDPEGIEQGLAKLVLTLIEFLRQLLERQAVRRMEGGSLSDEEIERIGLALMRLEEKVQELARHFGLRPGELNVNLGPLGDLL